MIVILDTNFLLAPARLRIDIFEQIKNLLGGNYELAVIDESLKELEDLKKLNKNKTIVNIAESLIKDKKIRIIKTKSFLNTRKLHEMRDADDVIVELVKNNPTEYIVATQDKELRDRLKKEGVKSIFIRKKSYLDIN